jgi:hypothetical protein
VFKFLKLIILKAAVEREKAVQAIDGHRECKNCVVTFWVMSQWLHFLGASRGCADFRDPTAVFRFKLPLFKKLFFKEFPSNLKIDSMSQEHGSSFTMANSNDAWILCKKQFRSLTGVTRAPISALLLPNVRA